MTSKALIKGIDGIIKEFGLEPHFPRRVEEESNRIPPEVPRDQIQSRVDLRGETTVTIDGENARDFDDAVSVRALPGGGTVLKVSIADVGYYVPSGSETDREAFRRGTSTYFPDRVIPMLPERLSNDLCSLVPHRDRLTFTAEMEFDGKGRRVRSRFYRSLIRSAARLTYTQVRKVLVDRDREEIQKLRSLERDLLLMEGLSDGIGEVRRERGSLDFDLPEPLIEIDLEEGRIDRIVRAERNKAHRIIEEFMIAANEAVAEFIAGRGLPMIFRVHEIPDPVKIREFGELLHNLGVSFRPGKKIRSSALAGVTQAVRGRSCERFVNTLLLRTMKRAVYAANNVGHFGLASDCYTHFTSPIRRYPDLVVHRLLAEALKAQGSRFPPRADPPSAEAGSPRREIGQRRAASGEQKLHQIAVDCSERERNSMKAEWASRDLAAALFMQDKVGERYDGIISSVTRFGLFVELQEYFVEGLVSLRSLRDDYYLFHEKSHQLVGRRTKKKYQIGLPISVRVKGVNPLKRWVDLEI